MIQYNRNLSHSIILDAISYYIYYLSFRHNNIQILNMDVTAWSAIYTDLPSKQLKVPVTGVKKEQIKCNEDETRLVSPVSLQHALDIAMNSIPSGRCFIRPSGTEDVVRVYAEAATQDHADTLAQEAIKIINDFINSS